MTKNDAGSAFPHVDISNTYGSEGMSLRDWFAGMAMQSLAGRINAACAEDNGDPIEAARMIAEFSYLQADSMLAERDKT